jgi:predicted methyltransferase
VSGFFRAGAAAGLTLMLAACAGMASKGSASAPTGSASRGDAPISSERIAEILAAPDRSAADRNNDLRRKPAEMLAFIGPRAGMTVLDVSAGGGYTTELMARAVGPTGRVYGQSPPPRDPARAGPAAPEGMAAPSPAPMGTASTTGSVPSASSTAGSGSAASSAGASAPPPRTSAMAVAERARKPAVANMSALVQPFENPAPAALAENGFDAVTLMFNYHDLGHLGVDRAQMNAAIFRALKAGGVYVVADHAGRAGTGISESGTLHRIEEAFLRREVERAGFRFVAEADFLRNPNDPRDMNTPNPPQPKDDFVMKFVKP